MLADFVHELGAAFSGFGLCHAGIFNAKTPRSKGAKREKILRLCAFASLR
jgi:hypothetical protein